jgi:hypothetical protein
MKEGVTGPIREFDKAEPFLGIEPFDDALDWWTGRTGVGCGMYEAGGRSCQRRTRDAAGYGKLGVSTLIPGGLVPDQSDRATRGRAVADLMGSLVFDIIRSWSESSAGRSGCRLGGLVGHFCQEEAGGAGRTVRCF